MKVEVILELNFTNESTVEIKSSEIEIKNTIIIDKNKKTITGLKKFFEAMLIQGFIENKNIYLKLNDLKKLETNTSKEIADLIKSFIEKFNSKEIFSDESKDQYITM